MPEEESTHQNTFDHGNPGCAKDSKEQVASSSHSHEPEVKTSSGLKVHRENMDHAYVFTYQDHKWDNISKSWKACVPRCYERWWIENPPSLPQADPGYLCELCRHIDFRQLVDKPKPDETIFIGTPQYHSQQTSCSFCSLITHGYQLLCPFYQDFVGPLTLHSGLGFGPYNFPKPLGHLALHTMEPGEELHHRPVIYRIGTRQGDGRRIPAKLVGTDSGCDWLAACESSHDAEPQETVVHDFLLIDVVDGCVKRVSGNCKYAALSYVPGEAEHVCYEASTKEILEKPNGLFSNELQIPRTIKDAAELTRHIGLRYLWVASLCVRQDDTTERAALQSKIGSIYRDAAVTIVDAYGSSANDGLPGISIPRSDSYIRQVQGMELASAREISYGNSMEAVSLSPWSKLAWTFQEKIMSSRLLFVTEKQLRLMCGHTMYFEELNAHLPRERRQLYNQMCTQLQDYQGYVSAYSRRTVTHETDIFSAFSGILEILSRGTSSTHFFNLPATVLDEALLWTTDSPYDFQRTNRDLSSTVAKEEKNKTVEYWKRGHRRNIPGFPTPSWSWAGWDHGVRYHPITNLTVPSILWKCRTTHGPERLLSSQEFRCATWRELGWKCLKQRPDFGNPEFVYVHPSKPDLYFPHPVALGPDEGSAMSPMQGSTLLTFQGFCLPIAIKSNLEEGDQARMSLGPERHKSWQWLEAMLYDNTKHKAGSIRLDVSLKNRPSSELDTGLIALSRFTGTSRRIPFPADDPLDLDETLLNNISVPHQDCGPTGKWDLFFERYDKRKFEEKLLNCYNVLLVEWEDGVAYRIGLGHIHIDAFHAADPVWQDVRLG